ALALDTGGADAFLRPGIQVPKRTNRPLTFHPLPRGEEKMDCSLTGVPPNSVVQWTRFDERLAQQDRKTRRAGAAGGRAGEAGLAGGLPQGPEVDPHTRSGAAGEAAV